MNLNSGLAALWFPAFALVAGFLLAGCSDSDGESANDEVRLNHIQVIGSHNSYHLKPRDEIYDALLVLAEDLAESIEYSHESLTTQLDTYGIRQFELDLYSDPDGGHYANHAAHPLVELPYESGEPKLDEPGFKVMHTQDFDYNTTCISFVECLQEIEQWSTQNPNHVPIMIMLEIKTQPLAEAAVGEGLELEFDDSWAIPLDTTPELLDDLDEEIRSVFADEHLVTPDDLRGDHETLPEAIETDGWPTLEEARGKVLFTMINGGEIRDMYTAGASNLEGRPIFTDAEPGDPDAAFVRVDDPTDPKLAQVIEAGYISRTRTDSPTDDARQDDTTRRDAALASGAQYLSTDYYKPSEHFESDYTVTLPGGVVARCNPLNAPESCTAELVAE